MLRPKFRWRFFKNTLVSTNTTSLRRILYPTRLQVKSAFMQTLGVIDPECRIPFEFHHRVALQGMSLDDAAYDLTPLTHRFHRHLTEDDDLMGLYLEWVRRIRASR